MTIIRDRSKNIFIMDKSTAFASDLSLKEKGLLLVIDALEETQEVSLEDIIRFSNEKRKNVINLLFTLNLKGYITLDNLQNEEQEDVI